MTLHRTLVAAAVLALLYLTSASASDWKDVKDAVELRALYANKTHHRKTYDGQATVAYYRADGTGLFVIGDRRVPRTWTVKGGDQVCWKDDLTGERCVRVKSSKQNPKEIIVQEVGNSFGIGGFTRIEDGIPQF